MEGFGRRHRVSGTQGEDKSVLWEGNPPAPRLMPSDPRFPSSRAPGYPQSDNQGLLASPPLWYPFSALEMYGAGSSGKCIVCSFSSFVHAISMSSIGSSRQMIASRYSVSIIADVPSKKEDRSRCFFSLPRAYPRARPQRRLQTRYQWPAVGARPPVRLTTAVSPATPATPAVLRPHPGTWAAAEGKSFQAVAAIFLPSVIAGKLFGGR